MGSLIIYVQLFVFVVMNEIIVHTCLTFLVILKVIITQTKIGFNCYYVNCYATLIIILSKLYTYRKDFHYIFK